MTEPTRTEFHDYEQTLSSDFDRVGQLAGRAAQDLAIGLIKGPSTAVPSSVREGFEATPGAGLSVDLSAGELMRFDAAILLTANGSRMRLARSYASVNAPLSPADGANPRIDLIVATDALQSTDPQSRNFKIPPSTAVIPQTVDKTVQPSVTVTVVTGTASASPTFPNAPAGTVALWYVYVPAGAVAITNTHLMDARIRFQAWESLLRVAVEVGFQVGTDDGVNIVVKAGYGQVNGARLVATTDFVITPGSGLLAPGHAPIANETEYHVYAIAAGSGQPVGKTVVDGIVYVMTTTAPSGSGLSVGVPYNALQGTGLTAVWPVGIGRSCLYLGTVRTNAAGLFTPAGPRLNRNGTSYDPNLDPVTSRIYGGRSGFARAPGLRVISSDTVDVNESVFQLNGVWGSYPNSSNGFVANLMSGVVESASTWYYAYIRFRSLPSSRSTPRNFRLLFTTAAPNNFGGNPSPEAGYASTDYLFVGAVYNDTGLNLVPTERCGDLVLWKNRLFSGLHVLNNTNPATDPASTTVTPFKPVTAKSSRNFIEGRFGVTSDQGSVVFSVWNGAYVASEFARQVGMTVGVAGGGAADVRTHLELDVFGTTFAVNKTAAPVGAGALLTLDIWTSGYIEDVASLT